MRKITLKNPSSGTLLTNNELKTIMGGVSAVISCTCDFNMNGGGVWSGFEDLPTAALQNQDACESACFYACAAEIIGCKSVASAIYINSLSN